MHDRLNKADRSLAGTSVGLPKFIPRTPLGWIVWGLISFAVAVLLVAVTFVLEASQEGSRPSASSEPR